MGAKKRRSFIFALSYKQSMYINDQLATSELAFLCDQRNRIGFVGAILIPFDGTFESHEDTIPVAIQKNSDESTHLTFFKIGKIGVSFSFRM